jgi:uncharacterized membrane protein
MFIKVFVCVLPVIVSGVLGWYMDRHLEINAPHLYWLLGSIGVFLTMAVRDNLL